jgi:hypothetical protein
MKTSNEKVVLYAGTTQVETDVVTLIAQAESDWQDTEPGWRSWDRQVIVTGYWDYPAAQHHYQVWLNLQRTDNGPTVDY